MSDCWSFFLFLLFVVGIILLSIYLICRAAHICGNDSSSPPSSSGPGAGGNAMPLTLGTGMNGKLLISTNDNILSGSTKISLTSTDLSSAVGVWKNTSGYHDPYLDTGYPYAVTVNYSIQTTTNLGDQAGWHTVCTVVQWGTCDLYNPLICQILYTNSVTTTNGGVTFTTNGCPIGTNWVQFSLDSNNNVTKVVVYGGKLYMPPIDTHTPNLFLKTWFNTNNVSTIGP
jgi:hypothetical protein